MNFRYCPWFSVSKDRVPCAGLGKKHKLLTYLHRVDAQAPCLDSAGSYLSPPLMPFPVGE